MNIPRNQVETALYGCHTTVIGYVFAYRFSPNPEDFLGPLLFSIFIKNAYQSFEGQKSRRWEVINRFFIKLEKARHDNRGNNQVVVFIPAATGIVFKLP